MLEPIPHEAYDYTIRYSEHQPFYEMRNDGSGLQFVAQPYRSISGVAGDAYGGLWWIETPDATIDLRDTAPAYSGDGGEPSDAPDHPPTS